MGLQCTEDGYALPTQTARADIAGRRWGHRRHLRRRGVSLFRHGGIIVVVEPHITYLERSPLTAILRPSAPRLPRVKTSVPKLALVVAAAVGILGVNVQPSLAYQTGDSRWCAVINRGDVISWGREYDSNDDCAAAVAGRSIRIGAQIHRRMDTELVLAR
jgi:hypothetical protein